LLEGFALDCDFTSSADPLAGNAAMLDDARLRLAQALHIPVSEVKAAGAPCSGLEDSSMTDCSVRAAFEAKDGRRLQSADTAAALRPMIAISDEHACSVVGGLHGIVSCWGRSVDGRLGIPKGAFPGGCCEGTGSMCCSEGGKDLNFGVDELSVSPQDLEFHMQLDTHCSLSQQYGVKYWDLQDAKDSCAADKECGGVYSDRCIGDGGFRLCLARYTPMASEKGSCVYDKAFPSVLLEHCNDCDWCGNELKVGSDLTLRECQQICKERPDCMAVEIGEST
jgi:hypothetical protein